MKTNNTVPTTEKLLKTTNDLVSSSISYGKTNLQKENVDEPEILKLTKDYIAYYNKKDGKIYIISSPVN